MTLMWAHNKPFWWDNWVDRRPQRYFIIEDRTMHGHKKEQHKTVQKKNKQAHKKDEKAHKHKKDMKAEKSDDSKSDDYCPYYVPIT